MNGPENLAAAQRILSEASFRTGIDGYPCKRDGRLRQPGEHQAMLTEALVHAVCALVAVNAQQLADKYVGDGPHINAWRDTWVARNVVEAEIVCAGCSDPDGHPGPCTQPLTPDEQAAETYAAGDHDDLPF